MSNHFDESFGNRLQGVTCVGYLGVKANVKQRHIKLMMFLSSHSLDGKLIRGDYDNKIFHEETKITTRRSETNNNEKVVVFVRRVKYPFHDFSDVG